MKSIRVDRASEHNLKDVSLEIPRDAMTVFTGVSGSGKSSLAFDTIYREGQRRFLESLPAYSRQFLGGLEKPKVDHVEGLSPSISVDQKTVGRSPRSTVGTITEIHDYLRLLWARVGEAHCPACGRAVASQSAEQIWERVLARHSGRTALVCAPVVRDRRGEHQQLLEDLRRDGHLRVRIDGRIFRLRDGIPPLRRGARHTVEVVWDRLEVDLRNRSRWIEAIEKSLELAEGVVSVVVAGPAAAEGAPEARPDEGPGAGDARDLYSSELACAACGVDLPELEPSLFSFNSHRGACPTCRGLGEMQQVDPELLVTNPSLPLGKGGIELLDRGGAPVPDKSWRAGVAAVGARRGFTLGSSWGDLDPESRRAVLRGDPPFPGLVPLVERALADGASPWLERFLRDGPCASCGGARLRPEARAVRVGGKGLHEVSSLSLSDLHRWIEALELPGTSGTIADLLRKDVILRLRYLEKVGLGYLALERRAATLAGGEAQRLRLASQVGTALQGVLFVLDEPSIGLHSRDHARLLETLGALRDLGNTVLVVEHDRATMEAADHIVDLGPGAGPLGGEIVAQGSIADLVASDRSLTGQYLGGRREIPVPARRRPPGARWLELGGARQNNLRDVDVRFPLGLFVAVTGVSGSGKSSLVNQVLRPAVLARLGHPGVHAGAHRSLLGYHHLGGVVEIDQGPIGKTPRSNPATYVKIFDLVRDLFAKVPEARARGYTAGRFSFNKDGGRCIECGGAGVVIIEMQLLAPVEVTCDTCGGKRYNRETLEIKYRGKDIHDVLEMPIAEAAEFFRDHPKLHRPLETLVKVGLGYMKLGQPSTMLSGGEAQRVKLAAELKRRESGKTLYILDEPTTGLHFEDVRVLLDVLAELVDRGNTVLVIEHNLDVIKVADWVIDLGPEGGDGGGRVVAQGTPEDVAGTAGSWTGAALREVLGPRPRAEAPTGAGARAAGPVERVGPAPTRDIRILEASEHNLKGVDVTIPHGSLTVVTGVSGSGKTSLAFDTLFAEGQRRYLESLSTYARRFLGRLPSPSVRRIEGLSPTIAIDQRTASSNPRSTVATVTEIHDYLRLLFARVGRPHCPGCGEPLVWTSPTRLAGVLVEEAPGKRLAVLAPVALDVAPRAEESPASAAVREAERLRSELLKSGFTRVVVAGEEVRLDEAGDAAVRRIAARLRDGAIGRGDVLVVVDRVVASASSQSRLAGSIEQAFERGLGTAAIRAEGGEVRFHTRWPACPEGHFGFREELTPSMFSFSSHQGACPRCGGSGMESRPDLEKILTRPDLPVLCALDPRFVEFLRSWRPSALASLRGLLDHLGVAVETPFSSLAEAHRRAILDGVEGGRFPIAIGDLRTEASWPGLLPQIAAWALEDTWVALPFLKPYLRLASCTSCRGGRLRPESLAVRVGGRSIQEVAALEVAAARGFFRSLSLDPRETKIAERILVEIENRLRFLEEVGLGYLGLDRTAGTLSGGEAQRIRLASQLGNRLSGVLYVLDEPTVGLHQRDTRRLLESLRGLRDLGNTVVVVEHDRETLLAADWIIDVGPGAGERGGRIVAEGKPADVARADTPTGRFLRESAPASRPAPRRPPGDARIEVEGIRRHNLDGVRASFPLGLLTVVTGVSGSGKSTLVLDVLAEAVDAWLRDGVASGPSYREVRGLEALRRLVVVDQQPIGRTPRSNPATYTGVWDHVRALYASLPLAKVRGYGPGRFSFNTGDGRCRACEGQGARQIEMQFLSDIWVPCEQCGGSRFDRETLGILFKGRNVGEVLAMEVDEALGFFENHPAIQSILSTLRSVGLGYVKLGQSADTLSGGEAQRVKLATELITREGGGTLYILDEPTTGLHHQDVLTLLGVLEALVEGGNTLVVIEHQLDVIRAADWVIDLGPEAGADGGRIVAEGPPEAIAAAPGSHTGRYLAGA